MEETTSVSNQFHDVLGPLSPKICKQVQKAGKNEMARTIYKTKQIHYAQLHGNTSH